MRPRKDLQGHLVQCYNFTNEETEAKKKNLRNLPNIFSI